MTLHLNILLGQPRYLHLSRTCVESRRSPANQMRSFVLLVLIVFVNVVITCCDSEKSLIIPNDDLSYQDLDQDGIGTLSSADNQLHNVQYKRKTPPSGHASNDITRQSSSAKPLPTQRTAATLTGNDDPAPISQVLSLLLDLSRNMAAMRDVINDIRFQNHVTYRQLKRIQLQQGKCNSGGSLMTSQAATVYQLKKPDMGRKLPSFVKSALHADRPQSDQQQLQTAGSNEIQRQTINETEAMQQRCPKEFTYSVEMDSCYRLAGDRTTWRLARERCRSFDADLATVDSAREQRYLNDRARQGQDTKHCDFWIGLVRGRDTAEGGSSWHWIGDHGNGRSPEYTNWNLNEPNNANSYEHCTQMLWVFNWRWNDAHCNYGNACYICQAKPRSTTAGDRKSHQ